MIIVISKKWFKQLYKKSTALTDPTRMGLTRAHTSTKAADVATLLLLNKFPVAHILPHRVWWCPTYLKP